MNYTNTYQLLQKRCKAFLQPETKSHTVQLLDSGNGILAQKSTCPNSVKCKG